MDYFRRHRFVKDFTILQIGSFGGNIVQAVAGIFIARILQPEKFGIYALAFGLASFVSLFIGIGAQDAATTILGENYTRKNPSNIADALAFLLKITILTGLISIIGAGFLPWIAGYFYHNSSIGVYAAVLILAVLFSSTFFAIATIGLQVAGNIRGMSILKFTDQALRFILSVIFVFGGLGVLGAMLGQLLGAVIIFVISAIIWERLRHADNIFPSLRNLISRVRDVSIRKFLGFSFWIAADKNIANLYSILPVLITGIFLSSTNVTFFKLSFGYMNLVLSFLTPISILLNVEFPKMQVVEGEKLSKNFVRVSLYSLGLSSILTIGAIVVSPVAFRVLYGASFMPGVKYVAYLVFYGCLMGIGVGLGPMWRAVQKVKTSIIINTITLGVGIPLAIVLIRGFGLIGTVISVSLWYIVSQWISFLYLANYLKKQSPEMI